MQDFFDSDRIFGESLKTPQIVNKKTIKMMKNIYWVIIILGVMLLTCGIPVKAQTKPVVDSVALLQNEWNKHVDSLITHTSIKEFNDWLYENATVKQYNEGKFTDFYNAFIQQKYQLWISKKKK